MFHFLHIDSFYLCIKNLQNVCNRLACMHLHINGLETEFVLLIMTGREANETDAKLKLKISERTQTKGINECFVSPIIKIYTAQQQ